jgi:hypothetical protein
MKGAVKARACAHSGIAECAAMHNPPLCFSSTSTLLFEIFAFLIAQFHMNDRRRWACSRRTWTMASSSKASLNLVCAPQKGPNRFNEKENKTKRYNDRSPKTSIPVGLQPSDLLYGITVGQLFTVAVVPAEVVIIVRAKDGPGTGPPVSSSRRKLPPYLGTRAHVLDELAVTIAPDDALGFPLCVLQVPGQAAPVGVLQVGVLAVAVGVFGILCEIAVHGRHVHVGHVAQPQPGIWLARNDGLCAEAGQVTIRFLNNFQTDAF